MTVMCSYGWDDVQTNGSVRSVPPPGALVKPGPLALSLQTYPGETSRPTKPAPILPGALP